MSQSKLHSFLEASANTSFSIVIAILTWMFVVPVIYPQFIDHADFKTALGINIIFTIVSVGRNYIVRRLFNRFGKL